MESLQYLMRSPVGDLFLVASNQGLQGLYLEAQPGEVLTSLCKENATTEVLQKTAAQLDSYFAGKLRKFDVPLDLKGTNFQKRVWEELLRVPFGETVSYKQIAQRIGKPAATRAVGSANGKNPVCIIVPCHRVITSRGEIGGYSGGLDFKRSLLDLEGAWPIKVTSV